MLITPSPVSLSLWSLCSGMNRFSIQYKLVLNTYWTQGTYLDEPGNDVHSSKLSLFFPPVLELLWWFKWQNICLQYRRFGPWVRKTPWRRRWLPTPVFWPGEFHGLYSPWGHKELDTNEHFQLHFLSLLTLKQADLGVPLTSFVSVLPCSPPHFPTPALTPYHSCASQLAQLSKHLSWCQLGCVSCRTVRTIFEVRGQRMKEEPPAHTTFQSRSALPFHFTLSVARSYPTRRRQWHPTPVLLPARSHGWRNLVGCSPWGC